MRHPPNLSADPLNPRKLRESLVSPISHVRDSAPFSPARLHRAYAVVLASMGLLAGLIGAAVAMD